jgi:hypothetical protein
VSDASSWHVGRRNIFRLTNQSTNEFAVFPQISLRVRELAERIDWNERVFTESIDKHETAFPCGTFFKKNIGWREVTQNNVTPIDLGPSESAPWWQ